VAKSKKRASKDSMRAALPENPPQAQVYDALAGFNRSFDQVLQDLGRLETLDLFTHRWQRRAFKACRATLEEMRAWANFEVIEVLRQREEREWTRLGRRRRLEKRSAPPDEASVPTKSGVRKSSG
jgi:hypothetical protein